jgi:DDE superfamily endonuclease
MVSGEAPRPQAAGVRGRVRTNIVGLVPLYVRAPKGERTFAKAPKNREQNTMLLAPLSLEGIGPCVAVEGSTTRAVFEAYVEQVLAPTLKKGHIVPLDNLSAHKGTRCVAGRSAGRERAVLATLLASFLAHRGSLLEGKGPP